MSSYFSVISLSSVLRILDALSPLPTAYYDHRTHMSLCIIHKDHWTDVPKIGIGDFCGMHEDMFVLFRASPGYVGLPITSFQKHKKVLIVFQIYLKGYCVIILV